MRKFLAKYSKKIIIGIICIVSSLLLITAVSMLMRYSDELFIKAQSEASTNTMIATTQLKKEVTNYTSKAESMAIVLSEATDEVTTYAKIQTVRRNEAFSAVKTVRYISGGQILTEEGHKLETYDLLEEYYKEHPNTAGYIGSFNDDKVSEGTMTLIGFYAPVTGSPFVQGVCVYYTRSQLLTFFPENGMNAQADFSVLVMANSHVEVLTGNKEISNTSLKEYLRTKIGKAEPVNDMLGLVLNGQSGTIETKIGGKEYVISVGADKEILKDIAVCELYSKESLVSAGLAITDTLIMIIVMFALIAFAVIALLIIRHFRREREYFNMSTTDVNLQCLNRNGFEKVAQKILERTSLANTNYYCIIVKLKHFKHIKSTVGEGEINHLLLHLRVTITKLLGLEETFGYKGDGEFLMLIHARNQDDCVTRLKTLSYLSRQYKSGQKFDVLLKYGIYALDKSEKVSVSQMIDFAIEANNSISHATEHNTTLQFNMYNNELRKIRLMNEDMELRMEGALKNGEFQLFYQPKYNLKTGKQDGAEALVRWYDPKTQNFNPPALFMQLFETNGFIVKLDKYVYTKVCEYIHYTISHGGTVYPISVNVSRITAVQPDFVEYYYNTKRRYGISDGLIMIEFTESFAYENYTTLNTIVSGLHDKGFKCSIDDFGCGYSSYRILKSLPMDEIKLDKFFLEKSDSVKRDLSIFKSIIDLAKDLGMKVTQEGVETKEDLDLLISLGCDVIQGYYYSYPLPLTDYITFVASSREHNIT